MSEELQQPRTLIELQAFIQESLEVQDAMLGALVQPGQGGMYTASAQIPPMSALLWVDMTKRPELKDLARRHQTDGDGESVFTWVLTQDPTTGIAYFILHVKMLRPVRVSFRIRFPMPDEEAVIEAIAHSGRVLLLEGPAPAWREQMGTMSQQQLLETIFQKGDVSLYLPKDNVGFLSNLFETWKTQIKK